MVLTAECWTRTVGLRLGAQYGTGFTITLHDRQWLVTAGHLVKDAEVSDIVISTLRGPRTNRLERIPILQANADVAVFAVDGELTQDLPLEATTDGIIFSQDAYFLGFPFGIGLNNLAHPALPFVKRATVSGLYNDGKGTRFLLLDAINNEGFSGGPVFYCQLGVRKWRVGAVVTGYFSAPSGSDNVPANTGILIAYDIIHAVESIDAFVGAKT